MARILLIAPCLFFTLAFVSCNKEEGKAVKYSYNYQLSSINIEKIKADEHTSLQTMSSPQIVTNYEDEYFVFFNKYSYQLYIYNLTPLRLVKKITFYKEGPNGIGDCKGGVFVHRFDSIFVSDNYKIYLLDSMGNKKNTYVLDQLNPSAISFFDLTSPPFIKDSKLYMEVAPDLDPFNLKSFKHFPVILELDLQSSKKHFVCQLPDNYLKENYSPNFTIGGFCYNSKTDLLSVTFPTSSYIYQFNRNGDSFGGLECHSRYEPNSFLRGTKKMETSFLDRTKFYLMNNSYDFIFYDNFRNRYLRILLKKISDENFFNKQWKKSASAMILDGQFNVIGEQDLAEGIYPPFLGFTKKNIIFLEWKEQDEDHFYLHFADYSKKL